MEPQTRLGLARLTKMAFDGIDLMPLRAELLTQSEQSDDTDGIFMDLSVIDQLHGNQEMGLEWQAKALKGHRMFSINRRETAQPKLLVFAEPSHVGGNTPIEFLLETSDFEIITYYPDLTPGAQNVLPEHDVAFCAVPTDSDIATPFFETVRGLTAQSGVHTFNLPDGPVDLDRDVLARIFPYVRGLRFPKTTRITRDALIGALVAGQEEAALAGVGGYPYIIRPVGSHAGLGLEKVDDKDALVDYLLSQPAPDFFVSEYVDYATPADGQFRKYRIVFVNGKAFPCHMAIADQWDVWYLNAKMEQHPEKRAEEAAWMEDFDADFAARHSHAFEALTTGIGLNYFGIDCAEDRDGNLVVFEADNALIVHDMDSDAIFPYKSKHMHEIFASFEAMLNAYRKDDKAAVSTSVPH
ncbi:ATP-grasp domain-containing protein [Shimia sp.]|uniref:ATP-grasp domain-containing protein n=1 Tax=Shimia sp. TaxID=1954381 RepID=UPI003BAB7BBB